MTADALRMAWATFPAGETPTGPDPARCPPRDLDTIRRHATDGTRSRELRFDYRRFSDLATLTGAPRTLLTSRRA